MFLVFFYESFIRLFFFHLFVFFVIISFFDYFNANKWRCIFHCFFKIKMIKVVACLKKASRVVSQCMEPLVQIQYSITVLNHYLYFYEDKCGQVDLKIYWIYKNISMIQLMMEFFHILHLPVIRFQIFN